jgi:hypothetical protein
MPSTLFEAFHVYPIDRNHPVGQRFPYEYFLCFMRPDFSRPQSKFNILGFPVLSKFDASYDRRLRFQLRTTTTEARGELQFTVPPVVAIDLLQPIPNTILLDRSMGQLMTVEIDELKGLIMDYLPLP